jgi:hypothetical protein
VVEIVQRAAHWIGVKFLVTEDRKREREVRGSQSERPSAALGDLIRKLIDDGVAAEAGHAR